MQNIPHRNYLRPEEINSNQKLRRESVAQADFQP